MAQLSGAAVKEEGGFFHTSVSILFSGCSSCPETALTGSIHTLVHKHTHPCVYTQA